MKFFISVEFFCHDWVLAVIPLIVRVLIFFHLANADTSALYLSLDFVLTSRVAEVFFKSVVAVVVEKEERNVIVTWQKKNLRNGSLTVNVFLLLRLRMYLSGPFDETIAYIELFPQ